MTDLVAFLTARYDEEQRLAEAATAGPWEASENLIGGLQWVGIFAPTLEGRHVALDVGRITTRETADYVAAHDPARVLADIAAKRAILRTLAQLRTDGEQAAEAITADTPLELSGAVLLGMCGAPGVIEKRLAAPYASHPDFQAEWRIDG